MHYTFAFSSFDKSIGNWIVSNVTDMSSIFHGSPFNQDISSWDVSSVINMAYMFYSWSTEMNFIYNLNGWDVSNVSDCNNFIKTTNPKTTFFTIPNFTNCTQ
jgi:hypothetical protein